MLILSLGLCILIIIMYSTLVLLPLIALANSAALPPVDLASYVLTSVSEIVQRHVEHHFELIYVAASQH